MRKIITFIFLFFYLFSLKVNQISALEGQVEVINQNSIFHYYEQKADLLDRFYLNDFDYYSWPSNSGPFGYNRVNYPDIKTIVNSGTKTDRNPVTYFKTSFNVVDTSYLWAEAHVKFDDGVIIYLNGNEIYRNNVNTGKLSYTYTPFLVDINEKYETIMIEEGMLAVGNNCISIALFNNSITSDDQYLDFNLKIIYGGIFSESYKPERITQTYYQDVTTNKAFTWHTETIVTNSHLEYVEKTTDSINFDLVNKELIQLAVGNSFIFDGGRVHKVVVNGLKKDASYFYRVGDRRLNLWSKVGVFKTLGDLETISFLHMTDAQGSSEKEFASWKNTANIANKLFSDSMFTTFGGDMVNNGSKKLEWQLAINLIQDIMMNQSIIPTAGNHDGDKKYSVIDDYFSNIFNLEKVNNQSTATGVYYSLDFSFLHISVLNANDIVNKALNPNQLEWLENDLKNSNAKWKIVLTHKSLYTPGDHYNDDDIKNMRIQLLPLFSKYKVDLVLAGHDHVYYRSKPMNEGSVADDYEVVIDDNKYRISTDGTIYLVNNTANSSKTYALNTNLDESLLNPDKMASLSKSIFTRFVLDKYSLKIESYIVDEANDRVQLYDSYSIYKLYDKVNDVLSSLNVDSLSLDDEESINSLKILVSQISEQKLASIDISKIELLEAKIRELKNNNNDDPDHNEDTPDNPIKNDKDLYLYFGFGSTGVAVLSVVIWIIAKRRKRIA